MSDQARQVADALQQINRTWLEGRPHDLSPLLHPGIVMIGPGFNGRVEGRDAFIAGFVDFCENADLHEYGETDLQVDVVSDTAVASFAFEMVFRRSGNSYRATGRDLWVFRDCDGQWLALWRTLLDLTERPA